MRSAWRTRFRKVSSPVPSMLGGRDRSLTVCGWAGRSSSASSAITIRSPLSTYSSSIDRRVVFPDPVPPLTRNDSRECTISIRRSATAGSSPSATRSSRFKLRRRIVRTLNNAQSAATGGMTACNRQPFGSVASTHGCAVSRRRPARAARRLARSATSSGPESRIAVRRSPPPSSTQMSSGPFTSTSVTSLEFRSASSGPAPSTSASTSVRTSSSSRSLISPRASSLIRSANRTVSIGPSASAHLRRTSSISCSRRALVIVGPPDRGSAQAARRSRGRTARETADRPAPWTPAY